jgi:hypothetical protein
MDRDRVETFTFLKNPKLWYGAYVRSRDDKLMHEDFIVQDTSCKASYKTQDDLISTA